MTSEEGSGLYKMAQGIVERYRNAHEDAPQVIYVDRDCCATDGPCKTQKMFSPWESVIRLDVWHFMRRFAVACTTESHPLYGIFMSRLSSCIFQWDEEDLSKLRASKRAQLINDKIYPTDKLVDEAISKKEIARHCRRQTRGVKTTSKLIEQLLTTMKGMTDSCGVPLLDKDRIYAVWETQQRHIACIQDPPNIQLYTKISTISKAGVPLNVYRCARGSTSLESFHLHLARFIPGKKLLEHNNNFIIMLHLLDLWSCN